MSLTKDFSSTPAPAGHIKIHRNERPILFGKRSLMMVWPVAIQTIFRDASFVGNETALIRILGMTVTVIGWLYLFGSLSGDRRTPAADPGNASGELGTEFGLAIRARGCLHLGLSHSPASGPRQDRCRNPVQRDFNQLTTRTSRRPRERASDSVTSVWGRLYRGRLTTPSAREILNMAAIIAFTEERAYCVGNCDIGPMRSDIQSELAAAQRGSRARRRSNCCRKRVNGRAA